VNGYLVTGGCGFIGSNLVRLLLREDPAARVWNLDRVTYAGSGGNLDDLAGEPRYRHIRADVCDLAGDAGKDAAAGGPFRAVFHLPA
jgi:dTDP-glucose 4,6-dehydratase